MDMLSVLLYGIAVILRYLPSSDCFCAARILLAIDLSIWYLRTLDIFSAVKQLGPTLVMIGQMVASGPVDRSQCLVSLGRFRFAT